MAIVNGNSTIRYNYTFLKNVTKQLLDVDLERSDMPVGAYTLGTTDGRFLAAYDGVSWVRLDEGGLHHLKTTLIWTRTYREILCLGDFIHGGDKFKHLAADAGRFVVFQLGRGKEGGEPVLVQLGQFKPEPPKEPEPAPEPPNPMAEGEQWQDNAVPGPDIPENRKDDDRKDDDRKDDEEVPQ